MGKGKNEIYLKDETDLNDHIIKNACKSKCLKLEKNGHVFQDHNLYVFAVNLAEYFSILNRFKLRGIENKLIELLIRNGVENKTYLQDHQKMSYLKVLLSEAGYRTEDLLWNSDRSVYELIVSAPMADQKAYPFVSPTAQTSQPVKIGRGLIYSENYQKCLVLTKNIFKYDTPPFTVYPKEKESESNQFNDKRELLSFLIEEGKKGLQVQRYKGLGEMNPDQLWRTTMNPDQRNLLQVKIEDAVDSDEIFTILMGDEVEPRREFIQNNALEVTMLDI